MEGGSIQGESSMLVTKPAATQEWKDRNMEYAKLGRRISISFALIFLFGFNGALVVASFLNWKVPCDQPLKGFLLALGSVGILVSCLYFGLEFFYNKGKGKGKYVDMPKFVVGLMGLASCICGFLGVVYYNRSPTCNLTAPILYKWSFAAVLAFLILLALVVSVPILRVLLPFIGKIVGSFARIIAGFAEFCEGIGLRGKNKNKDSSEQDGGFGTAGGPGETAMSTFALYINSTALCWFFMYFIVEVYRSWDVACDQPLKTFILAFAIFGLTLTLMDFFYDVFKDPNASTVGGSKQRIYTYFGVIICVVIWGAIGWSWVQASVTCADTAPQIYRLSMLLTMAFGVFCVLLGSMGCLVGLDFCCSGRMRFVVVFEEQY